MRLSGLTSECSEVRYRGKNYVAEKSGHRADDEWHWHLLTEMLSTGDWSFDQRGHSPDNFWCFITVPIMLQVGQGLPVIFKYKPRGKSLAFLKQH